VKRLREGAARILWSSHPARPGPEYALLRESQWWPEERIAELQATELRRLVEAASQVPFYRRRFREAGIGAADIRSVDDVRRLPVLERSDLERLGIPGLRAPRSWGMRVTSSGSLGRPVEFLWPLSQMRWLDAEEARARAWLGCDVGERRLEVRCRPVGRAQAVNATLLNAEALHAPAVADASVVDRVVRSLRRYPPRLVWGVSNALYTVALALLDAGQPQPTRACWSGGNHLHPHYRWALQEAFRCEVYERYATMETGLVAHECPEGRSLHVPAEGILAEIVRADGSPAGPGETGDVLVTVLRNRATPLIRYRLGDRAVAPGAGRCDCGRGLPLFGTVAGRTADVLRTSTGALVGPREVVAATRPGTGSVVDLQVVQDGTGEIEIRVVQRDAPAAEADRARVAAAVAELVGAPRPPGIQRVDSLPLTPGGKIRTVVGAATGPATIVLPEEQVA
jgi:phenylacetate-CoA ligase